MTIDRIYVDANGFRLRCHEIWTWIYTNTIIWENWRVWAKTDFLLVFFSFFQAMPNQEKRTAQTMTIKVQSIQFDPLIHWYSLNIQIFQVTMVTIPMLKIIRMRLLPNKHRVKQVVFVSKRMASHSSGLAHFRKKREWAKRSNWSVKWRMAIVSFSFIFALSNCPYMEWKSTIFLFCWFCSAECVHVVQRWEQFTQGYVVYGSAEDH